MTDMAHIIKTTHHDTNTLDMLCGQTRPAPAVEPPRDWPPCAECIRLALNNVLDYHNDLVDRVIEVAEAQERERRRILSWVDDITLEQERINKRLRKMKRRLR